MRLAPILTLFLILQIAECIDQPLKEVPASDILDKIAKGQPVEYDHVIVKGDLVLDGLGLPIKYIGRTNYEIKVMGLPEYVTLVYSPLTITDSVIDGDVDLSNTLFNDTTDFRGSTFNGGDAKFAGCQFSSDADFSGSQFNEYTANFVGIQFNSDAMFYASRFTNTVTFFGSQFNGGAEFGSSQFNDEANFVYTQFNSYAEFSGSQFNGVTDFDGSQFNDSTYFDGSQFDSYTHFKFSQFNSYTYFDGSQFNSTADFTGSQFKDRFIGWDNIRDALTCDEATYLGLIKNFKEHGQFDDADDCYYTYRYRNMNTLPDFIGCISCGFGVRPMYSVYLSIIFIVLFGLVYWMGDAIYKLSAPAQEHALSKNKTWSLSIIWGLLVIDIKEIIIWFKYIPKRVLEYLRTLRPRSISKMLYDLCHKSFTTSVSLRDALYFSALVFFTLHPPHDWEYSEHWRYIILLEDVLGGIFITLFIVTLGNIIIRY